MSKVNKAHPSFLPISSFQPILLGRVRAALSLAGLCEPYVSSGIWHLPPNPFRDGCHGRWGRGE